MLHQKQVKSVLNKQKQRDSWFLTEYTTNAYEGCSCNCLYCYIRGSKYGENMDSGLVIKSNFLEVLERQLRTKARKREFGFVALGSATDAYMHHEEKWRLTEGALQLLLKYRFPVFISTKSGLILRDVELLKSIEREAILPDDLKDKLGGGVILSVSISTMDHKISSMLEPGAIDPDQRLHLLQQLGKLGFLTGVNAIPVLPFISDTDVELEKIISSASHHRADYILVGGLTLFGSDPYDSKTLFFNFLKRYNADLIPKYQDMYGQYYFPPRSYIQQLKDRSELICKKYEIRTSILNELSKTPT